MQVNVCGVRGSTPAPGQEFVRYGGHTSCLALSHDGAPPTLVLDAGTGLRRVPDLLGDQPFRGSILIGHLHWDHTQGLPFFVSDDCDGAEVEVLIPEQGEAVEVLARMMSPPHFPIRPTDLQGTWTFGGLEAGEHRIEGFRVLARDIPHSAGRTFGFRIDDGHHAVAYLSDHNPLSLGPGPNGWGPYHPAAMELAAGVDVLFHDAQCTAEELPVRARYGHSAADYAVELGVQAEAGKVVLYHHDPTRRDNEVDAMVQQFASAPIPVAAAYEGMVINLNGSA